MANLRLSDDELAAIEAACLAGYTARVHLESTAGRPSCEVLVRCDVTLTGFSAEPVDSHAVTPGGVYPNVASLLLDVRSYFGGPTDVDAVSWDDEDAAYASVRWRVSDYRSATGALEELNAEVKRRAELLLRAMRETERELRTHGSARLEDRRALMDLTIRCARVRTAVPTHPFLTTTSADQAKEAC